MSRLINIKTTRKYSTNSLDDLETIHIPGLLIWRLNALFYNYLCVCLFLPFPIDCELFRGTNYILLNFAWPALNTEISTKQTNNEFVEWKHEQMKGVKGISFWGPWKNDGNVNNNYPLLRVKNLVGALYTVLITHNNPGRGPSSPVFSWKNRL